MTMRITSANYIENEAAEPSLQEILVALSFALDLTEGAVQGHSIRSCLLAVRIALQVGLDLETISDLYYSCLLKDVGCSSNSARMCQIVGGDDRVLKAATKLEDWTRPHRYQFSTIKLLWEQALPGASIVRKGARLIKVGLNQHAYNKELLGLRCDRGAQIALKLGMGQTVAMAVRHLDEHWDGGGYPRGLAGDEIPVLSRLMCIAQHLDAFCMEKGPQAAMDALKDRAGRWFDPELVLAAMALDRNRTLWRECLPGDAIEETRRSIMSLHPKDQNRLSAVDIDVICEAFADVVDAKSPFTFRHSLGVLNASAAIGKTLGLAPKRIEVLRRAALLHDVGKLSVPNTILDKPSKLTDEEFTLVKGHPGLSAQILGRVGAFREIAVLAGEHHEKLDGSGYPFRLAGDDLAVESKILAVADIFAALSEHRPYREALGMEKIKGIMDRDIPAKLDRECYAALGVVMEDLIVLAAQTPAPANICQVPANVEVVEAFI